MIQIDMLVDGAGLIRSCAVQGHAGSGKRGSDVVCAAVSVLTRAFARSLAERQGVSIRGSMSEQGNFQVEVEYTAEGKDFLAGAGSFLIEGLHSVSTEFPDYCTITMKRRNSYGS